MKPLGCDTLSNTKKRVLGNWVFILLKLKKNGIPIIPYFRKNGISILPKFKKNGIAILPEFKNNENHVVENLFFYLSIMPKTFIFECFAPWALKPLGCHTAHAEILYF